jgi:hypothetical protein
LLQLVIDKPNRSAVDMRLLSHIWEAFLRWCAEQFEAKVGVRVLGMGEFCYRKDSIGGMDFLNPMFLLSESYARSFGLHDRRPKTQVQETDSIDLDVQAIASRTTDLLGEVIGKEVVEAALLDLVEKIGEACADPDTFGIVTIDFGFAKLFCENKSLEFAFGGGGKPPGVPPGSAMSVRSSGSVGGGGSVKAGSRPLGGGGPSGGLGLDGSGMLGGGRPKADAPLQRPHRPHMRPVQYCARYTKDDLQFSHVRQLTEKELVSTTAREEETSQHLDTLQRLRSEMVLDYSQREQRRELTKLLASHQKVQQEEKRQRDHMERRVTGMDHWPFRTEEQVQQSIASTNKAQKAFLDKQLSEKRDKLEHLKREAAMRQAKEQRQALEELKALDSEKRGGRGTRWRRPSTRPSHVMRTTCTRARTGWMGCSRSRASSAICLSRRRCLNPRSRSGGWPICDRTSSGRWTKKPSSRRSRRRTSARSSGGSSARGLHRCPRGRASTVRRRRT